MRLLPLLAPAMTAVAVLLGAASCQVPTPHTALASVEVSLTAADRGLQAYASLPLCEAVKAALCSDRAALSKLRSASQDAHRALVVARVAVDLTSSTDAQRMRAVDDARAAAEDFGSLVPLQVQR